MIQKTKVWVRVAGNAKNVKQGNPHGWRCFLVESPDVKRAEGEIPLIHWRFTGEASHHNVIPGINSEGKKAREGSVLAWIDFFGDVTIDADVLNIALQNPPNGKP